MLRVLTATRYLVIIPIIGLTLAAATLFIFGGYSLIKLIIETALTSFGLIEYHKDSLPIYVKLVEYVHMFLIGTVLYITAAGFFQLFIKKLDFPNWLRIESTEELESNLIGVTIVVLAVNFMAFSFTSQTDYLLKYGAGIAMPIAALALFLGIRIWAKRTGREKEQSRKEE